MRRIHVRVHNDLSIEVEKLGDELGSKLCGNSKEIMQENDMKKKFSFFHSKKLHSTLIDRSKKIKSIFNHPVRAFVRNLTVSYIEI